MRLKKKEVVMNNWFTTPSVCVNLSHVVTITLKVQGILFHMVAGDPLLITFDSCHQAEAEYGKLMFRITTFYHYSQENDKGTN